MISSLFLSVLGATAQAQILPLVIEGSYCDLYGGGCEPEERHLIAPGGTVYHSYGHQGSWSTPTRWGTWSWDPISERLSMVNDNPNGFPVELVAYESASSVFVTVYEDFGSFLGVSDVYYFDVDRIIH